MHVTLSHVMAPGETCKSHKTQLGHTHFSDFTYIPAAAVLRELLGDSSMGMMSVRELGRRNLSAGPM